MAMTKVFFSDLKSVRCSSVVEARLLRFWESKNVKHGGELMWMDLLMPETGCYLVRFHPCLNQFSSAHTFRNILKEGGLFDLSLFDVLATHNLYGRHRSRERNEIVFPDCFFFGNTLRVSSFVRWTRSAAMSQDSATAGSASGARPFCSLE
ncbi:hypothetical protein IGI04_004590, partial [Brassica rapa subsp. trilocularis]